MSRFLGTETEYGIFAPGSTVSPIVTSTHAVVAFAAMTQATRARWDFGSEHPLRDTRGFDLKRFHQPPVIDPDSLGLANVMLSNGARFYVDHAHPEYSSPELPDAWQAMIYDAAGNLILRRAVEIIADLAAEGRSTLAGHEPCPPLRIFKNNVDGKGASYGSHENYQYDRSLSFDAIAAGLIPFFVTRQALTGAGRVGIGTAGEEPGFQISQRADYIEQAISLETTLNRGIINTRDEPHADPDRWGRLHIIVGDANMSQHQNFLKLGTTSLVMDAIEEGADFSDLDLADPVEEIQAVSHDPSLNHRLRLADGRELTALEIQRAYASRVSAAREADRRALALWRDLIDTLSRDPLEAAPVLDWAAKWALCRRYLDRGLSPDDAKLKLIDLQYADIDPRRGLHYRLVDGGRMERLVPDEVVAAAAVEPPDDSRAWLRGTLVSRFPAAIVAASWESVLLSDGTAGARIHLPDSGAGSRTRFEKALSGASTVADIARALRSTGLRVDDDLADETH